RFKCTYIGHSYDHHDPFLSAAISSPFDLTSPRIPLIPEERVYNSEKAVFYYGFALPDETISHMTCTFIHSSPTTPKSSITYSGLPDSVSTPVVLSPTIVFDYKTSDIKIRTEIVVHSTTKFITWQSQQPPQKQDMSNLFMNEELLCESLQQVLPRHLHYNAKNNKCCSQNLKRSYATANSVLSGVSHGLTSGIKNEEKRGSTVSFFQSTQAVKPNCLDLNQWVENIYSVVMDLDLHGLNKYKHDIRIIVFQYSTTEYFKCMGCDHYKKLYKNL
ncbi:MAG: hypothetical protein Sylvanvirus3_1, partial [Sylvanvirus sp.]